MPVFFKNRELNNLNFADKALLYVYYAAELIWEGFISCFDKGYWVNADPWDNSSAWKNNK